MPIESVQRKPVTVVVSGPPGGALGGMASVCRQMEMPGFCGRFRLVFEPFTLSDSPRRFLVFSIGRHLRQLARWIGTLRRQGALIVHLHTCSGFSFYRSALDMVLARWMRCRTVLHIHGARFDEFFRGEPTWRRWLISKILAQADRVIALSQGWQERLENLAPDARVTVIENAVDEPGIVERAAHHGPCHFIMLARMDDWKGVEELLDAGAILKRRGVAFRLTLAGPPGSAGDSSTIAGQIAERGLKESVRYVGPLHGEDKERLFVSADVYVQPSRHEGMPLAVLEAMAHGLPIVATAVGAVPEVVEPHRIGLLVPARDPTALADALQSLANDAEGRTRMGQEARALAGRRFSVTRFQADLQSLYVELVGAAAQPGRTKTRLRPWVPVEDVHHPAVES